MTTYYRVDGGRITLAEYWRLCPEPFSFLSRSLPTGATVSFLRTSAYFPQASRFEPAVVLVVWASASVCATVAPWPSWKAWATTAANI